MNIYQPVRGVDGALKENSFAIMDDMGVGIGEGSLSSRVVKKMYPDRPLEIEMTMRAHPAARDTLFGALTARAERIKDEHKGMNARLFIRCALDDMDCREYFTRMGFDDADGDELFYIRTSQGEGRRRNYLPVGTKSIDADLRSRIKREEFLLSLKDFGGVEHASEWLEARMHEPGFIARSVYCGEDFVGHILCTGSQNEAVLEMVCVEQKWRGKGVASALADEAMAILKERNVPFLVARAARRNGSAMRMFRRIGFEWARTDCLLLGRDL